MSGVRVRTKLHDLAHDDLAALDAESLDPVHLLAVQREKAYQLVGTEVEVYVIAEPA